jgi:hypothetical protein
MTEELHEVIEFRFCSPLHGFVAAMLGGQIDI